MSVSTTTLTLTRVPSLDETLQKAQYNYQSVNNATNNSNINNNNNNSITSSATYYHFPSETVLNFNKNEPRPLTSEESLLLEKTKQSHNHTNATNGLLMHKSSSYNGITVKGKSTIIKQDSLNGRINTTLTDSDSEYGSRITIPPTKSAGSSSSPLANEADDEHDSFLVGGSSGAETATSSSCNNRRSNRSNSKTRSSICFRANAFISRNWYLSYLVPLSILLALMFVAYLTRDYAKRLLYWIETQNPWIIFTIFMFLFIVVSFPIVVGYFVLMITAGYLFGCIKGFLTVILGANMGIAIAHVTLRSLRHRLPIQKYYTFKVICGVALMFWVVQKARKELSETLLTDISSDGKLIDIQV
ncbi:protein aardvark [Lucilia cuprina]|uniref:protein aardvark n=1 Tax=Lucilia cuprina TaxID=7375 RepID=UPI001F055C44|nr:protein aardvark [Lucilia cuprina]